MVFSSLTFIYFFLPLVIILYYLVPGTMKNAFLLVASVFFYFWGSPRYVPLLIMLCMWTFIIGIDIPKREMKEKRRTLFWGIAVELIVLVLFKYYGFFVACINNILHVSIAEKEIELPLGISFITFQSISYLVDVYRNQTRPSKSIIKLSTYLCMFPQLIAGPIVRYCEIETLLDEKSALSWNKVIVGLERFVIGLGKKVLLANNLGVIYAAIQTNTVRSVGTAWLGIIAYTLQIYYDFSGYSDMAIGMGKMFGFRFPENFDYPYEAVSISSFWRKWHMTLSGWFREYVYIPLGGNRRGRIIQIRNIIIVWGLTGLWHGAGWNYILWGLYFGFLLIIEKNILEKIHYQSLPQLVRWSLTMLAVILGWVFFTNVELDKAVEYIKSMFGLSAEVLVDDYFRFHARENAILLVISVMGCFRKTRKWINGVTRKRPVVAYASMTLIYIACTATLVYSTYNPFLYFKF